MREKNGWLGEMNIYFAKVISPFAFHRGSRDETFPQIDCSLLSNVPLAFSFSLFFYVFQFAKITRMQRQEDLSTKIGWNSAPSTNVLRININAKLILRESAIPLEMAARTYFVFAQRRIGNRKEIESTLYVRRWKSIYANDCRVINGARAQNVSGMIIRVSCYVIRVTIYSSSFCKKH